MASDSDSWYRAALNVDDQRQQLIRNNVQQAADVNPDQDAQHQALARFAQIPTDAVRAYPKEVEKQVTAQRINAQGITTDTPSLARFLSVQDNANIVHDDIPHTAAIEQLHRQMPQPDESKSIGDSLANAPYALAQGLGGSFNKLFTGASLVASGPAVIFDKLAGTHSADWMFKNVVEPNVQNEQAFQLDKNAGLPEKALHTGGSLLGTLSQIILSGTGGAAAELSATDTAGTAVKQAIEHGAKSMALPAATDAIDVGRKVYQETGDGKAALRAANAQYVATTGMGIMPMSVAGNIPVRVASGAASGAVMGEASRQFTNANLPDQMKQPFSWEDTFLGGIAGGVLGLGGPAKPKSVGDVIRQTYLDADRADRAQEDYSKLSVLGQMSAASKLRERSPEAFRQFVQDTSDDGALQDTYINGRKLSEIFNQSGVTPEQLQEKLPEVAKQLGEAVQTDGDVRIPVADYATHIAGGPLDDKILQELKTSPDGMTYKDAQDFQKSQVEVLTDAAKKIADQTKLDDEQQVQAETIQSNIEAQLKDTKRFQPEVNKAYASLQTAYVTTRAEQLGMKPGEFYDKYGSSISADSPVGFDQAASRGSFDPKRLTIGLTKDADLSTFLHETGHYFLEVDSRLASMPDAPEAFKKDFQTTLDWMNVADAKTWNGMSMEQQRDYHEKFAKGFESYLFEGKAPTVEMQGVFSRFRSWLLNVYKKLVNIGSPINDEMRGVFDRMLASENAIKQAEQIRSMKKMFETKPEGMTDQQYTDYLKTNDQATNQAISELDKKSLANMKWLSNAKSKALRDLQRQADGERDKIREEVTKEIEARPEYQAETFLRKGEITKDGEEIKALAGHKLDTDRVKELIPQSELSAEDLKSLGYGKGGMLQKGGLDPDLVADMFGFPNGETLVRNLMGLEKRGDAISRMTDERMLERHGELVDPVSMDRAAEAAIHNDVRAKFLATELRNLSKATGPVGMLRKAAREAAEATIAGKRVGDIRPLQYLAAEAKTGREAEKFFKKADIQNAAEQKRAQLLNNQLYQAAKNALEDVRKGVDYLQKFDKEQKGIEIEYREQIDNLLDRFDLRKSVSNADLAKRQSLLEFANEQQAKGYEPNIPDYLLDEANKQHYKDLSVEQFRGLVDSVKSIEQLGKLKQKILDKNDLRDFKEVVGEAVSAMGELRQRTPESNRGLTKIDAKWLKAKQLARGADSSLLKMEQMLDWLDSHDSNGVFNRVIMRRMAEAEGRENDLHKELTSSIKELYTKEVQKDFNKPLVIPELTDSKTGQPQRLIKRELLAMALNSGNESNFQKMLKGESWKEEGVMAALNKHLTKADIDFVNGAWKSIESLWPKIEAMERRLGNSAPERVEGRPLDLANGRLEGGYYPVIYDATRSYDIEQSRQKSADQLFENNYQRATTNQGHTIERQENYARPLLLSLDALPRHLNQVVHDLSYREAVMDADRFFADPNVREGIEKALGPEYYQQMRPWLQAIANDRVYDSKGLAFWDKAAHWARTNATMVGLGYRVSTMLIHGSSAASNSVGEIGLRWFTGGIRDVLGTPQKMAEARDFIFERSDEVRHRINSFDRDISDAMKEMEQRSVEGPQGTAQRALDNAKRFAYYGVAMLDFASVMPTWKGAYNKALAPETKGGLGLEEKDAIYYADKAVRNAHGGTGVKDLSAVQRGGEVQKLFTMFYSFWNHFYNRQRDINRNAMSAIENAKSGNYEDARSDFAMVLARSWFYFVVPQLLHGALKTPSGNEDNHEESWAAWAAEEIGLGLFSGIPVVRDVANSAFTGRDYTATPAAQLVTALGKTGKDVENLVKGEEVSDKWLKHAVQTSGYVLGLPTGQVSNTTQFLWDVAEGRQNPEDLKDWWKGMIYGQ